MTKLKLAICFLGVITVFACGIKGALEIHEWLLIPALIYMTISMALIMSDKRVSDWVERSD